jgi:Zinc carboxypeptidase
LGEDVLSIRGLSRAGAASLAAAGLALAVAASAPLAAADYTRYHPYDELTAALRDLAKTHANLAKLVEVAKTREGRTVWAIEIANPSGTPIAERPALMIAANFEGDQVIGSALSLFVAESLLTGYATNPTIKQRLDEHAFYILPRVNPDAAELMFAPLKTGRKTNATRYDNDNDGRMDEDGPDDLNKDGLISMMRVKDPLGPYMIHPDDARLMRRADPQKGERGGYAVYWEGADNDGDGFYNEDPPGGVDLNRNFQHQYPYYQPDAGPHMVSEAEARGVMDYVLQRRNIAAVLTFGESDNLIAPPTRAGAHGPASVVDLLAFANQSVAGAREAGRFQSPAAGFFGGRGGGGRGGPPDADPPAGAGGRGGRGVGGGRGGPTPPATTINAADVEYFRAISDRYRQLTGLRSAPTSRIPGGAFFEYAYYQFGVPAFSTPGWGLPDAAAGGRGGPGAGEGRAGGPGGGRGGAPPPDAPAGAAADATAGGTAAFDLRLARWMDAEKVDGFAPWQPFKHPTLGDVEIGGFKPYATSNPPAARLAELGKSHAEFVTYLSSLFPKVSIPSTTVSSLGGGLYRIKADVENGGFLPMASAQGVRSRSVKPTMVQLGVDPADIVSGAPKTNFFPTLAGSGRRQTYEWIVRGKPGSSIPLKAVAQKGGTVTVQVALK